MVILRNKFIHLPWTKNNINLFKRKDNLLCHARIGKDIDGVILTKNNSLVGYIAWSKEFIIALEVMPEWRKQGIATYLISLSPVQRLTVNKNNNDAIKLYLDLGFRVTKEDSRILYMENINADKNAEKINKNR